MLLLVVRRLAILLGAPSWELSWAQGWLVATHPSHRLMKPVRRVGPAGSVILAVIAVAMVALPMVKRPAAVMRIRRVVIPSRQELEMLKSDAYAVVESLKACPFCGEKLTASVRGAGDHAPNPKASCKTQGCYGTRLPVLCLDIPEDVAAFNRRAS